MNKDRFFLKFKETFWFLPTVYGTGAIISLVILTFTDIFLLSRVSNFIPDMLAVSKSTARSLYSALVTAILTMTAITFSNIMVVLSTYSSQFSPRALQDFIHSKFTQHILGVFTFSFFVALLNLWFLNIQGDQIFFSSSFAVISAVVSLFGFIFFIHHASQWLQINYLLDVLKTQASQIIKRVFKEKDYGEYQHWDQTELAGIQPEEAEVIYAKEAGYVQKIEIESLLAWAKEEDIVVKADFLLGEYISAGMPIFHCWNADGKKLNTELEGSLLLLSNERTDIHDIGFTMQKIAEIALKGVSPSVNDPQSAINAIHRLGELLAELGQNYRPIRYYTDKEGELRLILDQLKFNEYLYKCFYQIRHYAKTDLSVMSAIFEVLYNIGYLTREDFKEDIWEFTLYILEAIDLEGLSKLDYQYVKSKLERISTYYDKELPL